MTKRQMKRPRTIAQARTQKRGSVGGLSEWKTASAVFLLLATAAIASPAQVFHTLHTFESYDGAGPIGPLVQGTDGNLYGITNGGGANSGGTVFKLTRAGTMVTLYNFCAQADCADGANPGTGLVLATDGNFYGSTGGGGDNGGGTVFKITSKGTLTTLHSFNASDGCGPSGALIQATDGNFYGTAAGCGSNGVGTVFKTSPAGTLTTLHSFNGSDGSYPYGGLIQATDGNFYGTVELGGGGYGAVFKITPQGTLTILHSFGWSDGSYPLAGLVQGTDGNFYGTTSSGGANVSWGTVFKMTPEGMLTSLYSFDGGENGGEPQAGLIQATDANFYGAAFVGGGNRSACWWSGCGTLFRITSDGMLTLLHGFIATDGAYPGGVIQGTDGNVYGVTAAGGDLTACIPSEGFAGCGTVFRLRVGLGPFVSFVRNPAKVGQTFGVLGQGFTGTTGVSLNGTPANFTVKSDTLLTAFVPVGATTGFVTVTTPSGTLASNVPFRVLPQVLSFDPPSGPVGTQVTINGVSLMQTTGVGFGDSVPADFTVNSDTQVTATVPTGARTGPVGVQTLGGTAISSVRFTVTP